ncbi:MAG: hypothetical protein AAGI38_14815 [Bacteroidota bacterium]
MNELGKIVGLNLLIALVYTLVIHLIVPGGNGGQNIAVVLSVVGFHAVAAIVLGIVFFVRQKPYRGAGSLLGMLVVLIIGFSYCVANFSLH